MECDERYFYAFLAPPLQENKITSLSLLKHFQAAHEIHDDPAVEQNFILSPLSKM
jgi:hypothetical protein